MRILDTSKVARMISSQDTKSGGGARRVGRSHYMHGLLLPLQPQQGNIVAVHIKRFPHRRYFVAKNDMKI